MPVTMTIRSILVADIIWERVTGGGDDQGVTALALGTRRQLACERARPGWGL